MKPTSPLSLLLFLQLASAAPLHYYHGSSPQCPFASCKEFLENGHTPPTTISKLTDPHFPTHQLSGSEEPIDNRPYTPSSRVSPSEALAANRPLSSAYLRSLSNPASFVQIQKSPIEKALPSKPTSALPVLRKEDAKRYWATTAHKDEAGDEVVIAESPVIPVRHQCGSAEMKSLGGGYFVRAKAASTGFVVREYSDVMVVGIVLLFLVIVVFIEAVEKFGSIGAIFTRNRRRHGEIYLEDDETVAYIIKKPFHLQPAPPSRYKIRTESEKSGFEKDGFQYDSDAGEMV